MTSPTFSSLTTAELPLQHPCKAIVFIHGIFSCHETFTTMHACMGQDPNLANVQFFWYDYNFYVGLKANGQQFGDMLCAAFQDDDDVVVIAHSMGGLVARLAVLSTPLPFLRVIFLLGTPNSGAIRLSQLALLAQMGQSNLGHFFALFPRKSGIADLSRAAQIIQQNLTNAINASTVDYVSIPGLFFHAERGPLEVGGGALAVEFTVWDVVLSRLLSIRMQRPHDGIVEEASNNLITCPAGVWHEKINSIGPQRGAAPATYAHIRLIGCSELNHLQIHNDLNVIAVVSSIVERQFDLRHQPPAAAPVPLRLEDWSQTLTETERRRMQVFLG